MLMKYRILYLSIIILIIVTSILYFIVTRFLDDVFRAMCTAVSRTVLSYRYKQHEKKFIEKLLVDNFTCTICLDIFKEPVGLNCGHMFCSACLLSWLINNRSCPICRLVIAYRLTAKCEFIEGLITEMKSTVSILRTMTWRHYVHLYVIRAKKTLIGMFCR